MWNLGTSLSYTSNLYGTIEARTETPRHFVDGMPARRVYAADQGWDELFPIKEGEPVIRRGASAKEAVARPVAAKAREADLGEQSP